MTHLKGNTPIFITVKMQINYKICQIRIKFGSTIIHLQQHLLN